MAGPFQRSLRPDPGTSFGLPAYSTDGLKMNLDSQAQNKPVNTDTLIRNFEWLRLGMTETITSEDLTDILSGIAFQILQYHSLWTIVVGIVDHLV